MVAGTSTLFSLFQKHDSFRQNSVDYSENFTYTDYRTLVRYRYHGRGFKRMFNENEEELLRMVRENDNPEQAAMIAIDIILGYLRQPESFEAQAAACLQALA